VEAVTNATLDSLGIIPDKDTAQYNDFDPDPYYWREPYVVQFNLKRPHADFVNLLYNTWGGYIMPNFVLGDIPHGELRSHETNYQYETLPGTGPWRIADWVKASSVTLEPNTHYWKTDFKPYETIDKVIVKIIVDDPASIAALKAGDIAFGVWGIPVLDWDAWGDPESGDYQPQLITFKYDEMFGIIGAWGETGLPMKSIITPQHFYTDPDGTTVSLFNEDIEYYDTNLTKAQYYMDLYLNQTGAITPELGPVGDADQSGLVNVDDWWIWRANFGTTASIPIDIYPTWPYTIDPDWDNDNQVLGSDEVLWKPPYYGTEY